MDLLGGFPKLQTMPLFYLVEIFWKAHDCAASLQMMPKNLASRLIASILLPRVLVDELSPTNFRLWSLSYLLMKMLEKTV